MTDTSNSSQPRNDLKIFFMLGGPGSGKGTNCARLAEDFGYTHLSAGDLLRAAARSGKSALAKKIEECISTGNIVPCETTVDLLQQAIKEHCNPRGYLIDGFPRKMAQAQMFEQKIARAAGIFYFDCPQEVTVKRMINRSANTDSARADDNMEVIRQRLRVNKEECMPVVEAYKAQGRCFVVNTNQSRDKVYKDTYDMFLMLGEKPLEVRSYKN